MANIQQNVITHIDGGIYGVAGYYSENDQTQHVVVATNDGTLYEIHWNSSIPPTPPQQLGQFRDLHSLAGFYTSDDDFQHVIVFTQDGRLHEMFFKDAQHANTRSPLFQLRTTATSSHIGMAGYYDSLATLRRVTVGGADDSLYEVSWNAQVAPDGELLVSDCSLPKVAAMAGLFDPNDNSSNVFVAMQDGDVSYIHRDPNELRKILHLTTTSTNLKNEAAFVNNSTHLQHVILLDVNGQVSVDTYSAAEVRESPLVTLGNVVDMAGYFSAYDSMCHVILATTDGNIHEVYYD